MTSVRPEGPSPAGDGPSALRRKAALAAMLRQADRKGMTVTTRQVEELLAAAAPHLAVVRDCQRVHPRRRPPATQVPSGPTIEVLRSLVVAGFPQMHLAGMLGMTPTDVTQLMKRPRVTVRMEQRVLALGERLRGADPLEFGVSRSGVVRARNHAARRGWLAGPAGLAVVPGEVA